MGIFCSVHFLAFYLSKHLSGTPFFVLCNPSWLTVVSKVLSRKN